MNNITRWSIKITMVSFILVIMCGCTHSDQDELDYGVLLAVPDDAGVIVKSSDLCGLCAALSNNNQIWTQLSGLSRFSDAARTIKSLDTLISNNNPMRNLLRGKSAMVSFHKEGQDNVMPLLGIQIGSKDLQTLTQYLNNYLHARNLHLKQQKLHSKTQIYGAEDLKKGKILFYITYTGGFFMASKSRLTIEQTIRHIHSRDKHITKDNPLQHLLRAAGSDATAVLIFNYKQLGDMFADDINKKAYQKLATYANWAVLDISIEKQVATCAGYSNCNKASQMLSIIKSQQPVPNSCHEYLPSKTTSFVSLGISDMHLFANDYKNHLQSAGSYSAYESNNENIRKTYGINYANILYTNLKGRITEFSCTYNLAGRGNDHYIIAELNNAKEFEIEMAALCKKYRQIHKIADKDGLKRIKTSTGNQYHIYKFPIKHTFNSYFGALFAAESEYMMMYKDMAVFGKTTEALYDYANNIDNGKTLANNSIYENFTEYINENSNILYYIDIAYSKEDICQSLSSANADEIANNFAKLHNIRSFAIQFSQKEQSIYTNAALMYSAYTEAERYISWIAPTDTTIRGKPQIVNMHETEDKDIIVQDETYKLYLFDKNGTRIFSKQMGEPLTSPIYQIDIYRNHKKQYVFATEHFLHALDRNGNYLDNFPVQLPASVSTEISVFDYDNTGDYRIFVPCTNRHLYIYTKEGAPLDAWTPLRTNEPIVSPVQHFRINDNDLLIFADNLKTYIINRRGEVRINVTNSFPKARNSQFYLEYGEGIATRFVTSNSSGEIKYIYTDGSCKSRTFKNFSADHHFVLRDIDGDGTNEYIFTDEDMLYVFRADGSEKFSYCFDGTVGRPNIFKFAANDFRIGVTCRSRNQLFLFDNKGKICSGFPMQGASEFSITCLGKDPKFSLLAGNADNYLYNYLIQ